MSCPLSLRRRHFTPLLLPLLLVGLVLLAPGAELAAQGVTTGAMAGFVTDNAGAAVEGATVQVVHEPTGTSYSAVVRGGGAFTIPNMRVGGPYTVTVTMIGYETHVERGLTVDLGQDLRLEIELVVQAVQLEELEVQVEEDLVLNAGRTGAATFISDDQVELLPNLRRSFRDLVRVDPRADGNFAIAGRNWLYNNISLDGSYFSNAFGLDDPAPGGQTASEPIPYTAIDQVSVQVAPFDIRQGGFTGANVNLVSKSGTNDWQFSAYGYFRNQDLLGNNVRGQPVVANPDLSFGQYGLLASGPIIKDKLFFFVNGEINRRDDPGTNFVANTDGTVDPGESRVNAGVMQQISDRMRDVYGYETGPWQGFTHSTNSDKLLLKLDWNLNENNSFVFRYNHLDAAREIPPHPFVFTLFASGRGPNDTSLPFQNTGYAINNNLNSFALEWNSRSEGWSNRAFASFNRFRDNRDPFSEPFPTVEIAEQGVTYTSMGSEPFSVSNILHQNVFQLTDNFTFFKDRHAITVGGNFESFNFFNSFNLFRHGFIPALGGYNSLDEFFAATDPTDPSNPADFRGLIDSGATCFEGTDDCPLKGENFTFGQLSFYAQDEFEVSSRFSLTYGLRLDMPMYFTDPVDNQWSRDLNALNENDESTEVDQSQLPGTKLLWSPRVGFNWALNEERSYQLRGGTGIFTGRIPFVWGGNNISNPGFNPNIWSGGTDPAPVVTGTGCTSVRCDEAVLQQSFFLNAFAPDFKWPQTWVTNVAFDARLLADILGTFEVVYGNDINAITVKDYDLGRQTGTNPVDGRPVYGQRLNPSAIFPGSCICVIDNTGDGWNLNLTAQLQKAFDSGLAFMAAYSYTDARNVQKSTEIAGDFWQGMPIGGNPNNPSLSFSEFGLQHRIIGTMTYPVYWSDLLATSFAVFFEVANGNPFRGAGGNRYSFLYSGDVNMDGSSFNDLIYIPASQDEITFDPFTDASGNTVTPAAQWSAFDEFIEQDSYLSQNRGQISERFGLVNPWWTNLDVKIMQDFNFGQTSSAHKIRLTFDFLNFMNLLSSDWGVRKVATAAATNPLTLTRFEADGEPVFNFNMIDRTFGDDLSEISRWRIQLGVAYLFN